MAKEDKEIYIPAPSCPNGKHELVDARPPWYAQCIHCKTRFALIAEPILAELGLRPVGRPLTKQ